jgi:ASCH domain
MSYRADPPGLALSIRQPWATLVVLGLKTIEIRGWSTPVRGRVYIHASKTSDGRSEGWSHVPPEHLEITRRRGCLIGAADLVDCISYRSNREFSRDCQLHFNPPGWFLPPRLFGFRFESPAFVAFRAISGQIRFFPVTAQPTVSSRALRSVEVSDRTMNPKKRVTFEIR